MASTKEADLLELILVEHLDQPSIVEEDISELEPDKLATCTNLAPGNRSPNELAVESDHKLAPC